jgi:N-acetylglucosaminyldiphosphoundecaprenol N-acetyl-beta-D-mannosaminyltransferase
MKIFDIEVSTLNKKEISAALTANINSVGPASSVYKINAEFLVRSLKNKTFAEILNKSAINIADGHGVMWAARFLTLQTSPKWSIRLFQSLWQLIYSGVFIVFNPRFIRHPIPEAIPGIEAFYLMLNIANKEKMSVFIFGSSQSILNKAIVNIKREIPGLEIAGFLNGYDYENKITIDPVEIINKSNAKLLIVALGSPKQEYWIENNLNKLTNIRIAVGEGGTLDRIANPGQRSPRWINNIGLEWFWRILVNKSLTEKRNRFQRVWNSVPVFIYKVLKWKIKYGTIQNY